MLINYENLVLELKKYLEEQRDDARHYADLAMRDREQYAFYFGRNLAFIEIIKVIKTMEGKK